MVNIKSIRYKSVEHADSFPYFLPHLPWPEKKWFPRNLDQANVMNHINIIQIKILDQII